MDISALALAKLREHGAQVALSQVTALSFADAVFDQVCALDSVEHVDVEDEDSALSELPRVATSGAPVLISVPPRPLALDRIRRPRGPQATCPVWTRALSGRCQTDDAAALGMHGPLVRHGCSGKRPEAPDPLHALQTRQTEKPNCSSSGPTNRLDLTIDSTALKVYGAGEWQQEKHGARPWRTWRKLHLAVAALTGMVLASTVIENDEGDPSQVAPRLDQIDAQIGSVTAYGGASIGDTVTVHGENIAVVIAPPVTAVLSDHAALNPSQRDQPMTMMQAPGRLGWQKETGYGRRSWVETTMGHYKALIGPRLRARSLSGQRTEAAVGVAVLNRLLTTAWPHSGRFTASAS